MVVAQHRAIGAASIRGTSGAVGFHPACWHGPTARRLPAMVAAITIEGQREPVAVHRTYLDPDGRKADVDPVKMMLGPVAGGAVRLADGPGPLVVGEGIESTASALDALAVHRPCAWAALSAGGIRALRLPAEPGDLVIAPDADPVGMRAAEDLGIRADADGWSVRLLPPPDGFKDWNEAATARRARAA